MPGLLGWAGSGRARSITPCVQDPGQGPKAVQSRGRCRSIDPAEGVVTRPRRSRSSSCRSADFSRRLNVLASVQQGRPASGLRNDTNLRRGLAPEPLTALRFAHLTREGDPRCAEHPQPRAAARPTTLGPARRRGRAPLHAPLRPTLDRREAAPMRGQAGGRLTWHHWPSTDRSPDCSSAPPTANSYPQNGGPVSMGCFGHLSLPGRA